MVWLVEKKIFYHVLDLEFERVKIPVRVKFEFQVEEGALVPDSISRTMLYNLQLLESRYPNLDRISLQRSIERKIDREIYKYLESCGYVSQEIQ